MAVRIDLRDVRRAFGSVRALDGVDLVLEPGEQLAVLGPSGSGKSTLLRVIAGLEHPDSGAVDFDGRSQLDVAPHERDVALVFQQYALYPHLSALENIMLGLRHGLGLPKAEAHGRAVEVAGRLGIAELLQRKPKAMSGGQRQRIALARALARGSGVVLLDEPLSGLDAQLRLLLRVEIARHLRTAGATVLHVTHDQSDAMTSADRVAVMRAGRIEQIGAPADLYDRPATLFVARFVGTPPMNAFEVGVDGRSPFGEATAGTTLGIRPEHLQLGGHGPWTATAVVAAVEHAGPEHHVHVQIGPVPAAVRTTDVPPPPGIEVLVSVDPAHVHVFDVDGRRTGTAAVPRQPITVS